MDTNNLYAFEITEKYFFEEKLLILQVWGNQETYDYFLEHVPSDIELENLSYKEASKLFSERLLKPWPTPPLDGLIALLEVV